MSNRRVRVYSLVKLCFLCPILISMNLLGATISINPIAGNDHINESEVSNPVAVSGTADADFTAGDTVTLTTNGTNFTGQLSALRTYSINIPGTTLTADPNLTVSASITSSSGGATAQAERRFSTILDPGYAKVNLLTVDEDSFGIFDSSVILGERFKNRDALRNLLGTKVAYVRNTSAVINSSSSSSVTFDTMDFSPKLPNGIRFTIYGTNSRGSGEKLDEEFLNCTIECDLEREIFSGFLTYFDDNDELPNLMSWNAQDFGKTAADVSTLAADSPYAIAGRYGKSQDVKVSVDSSGIITLEILGDSGDHFAVVAEFFESESASLEIIDSQSAEFSKNSSALFTLDSEAVELELALSGSQAKGRTGEAQEEDHAFGKIRLSKSGGTWTANGAVAVAYGTGSNYQQTYIIENVTIDNSNTIRYSSGDNASGLQNSEASSMNLILKIDGADLTVQFPDNQALDHLATLTEYKRTGIGVATAATFLSARKPATIDGVAPKLKMPAIGDNTDMTFYIDPGAKVMVIRYSGLAQSGFNQNSAIIEISIDLEHSTSAGRITGTRITNPDLISWSELPLGTPLFDAAGNPDSHVTVNVANLSNAIDKNVIGLTITEEKDTIGNPFIRVLSQAAENEWHTYDFSNAMAFFDGFEPLRIVKLQPGTTVTGPGAIYESSSDSYLIDPNADFKKIKITPPDNYNGQYVSCSVQRAFDSSRETELLVTVRSNKDPDYDSSSPVLENETLNAVFNRASVNSGNTIKELLSTSTQSPSDNSNGIAVIGLDNKSIGVWQYKAGASNWTNVPAVSTGSALLLSNNDALRFSGVAGKTGTPAITYRAWDQSGGLTGGSSVDLASHGAVNPAETLFSSDSDTASITVKDGAVTITITDDANNDAYVSKMEGSTDATITTEVTLPSGAAVNDTITVTDQSGTDYVKSLTVADLTAGKITIEVNNPGHSKLLETSATLTDTFGNVSLEAKDSATIITGEVSSSLTTKTTTYTGAAISANTPTAINGTVSKVEYLVGSSWTGTAPSDTGTYNVRVSITGAAGYDDKAFTFNNALVITKKTLTVTASANDKVYDGNTTAIVNSLTSSDIVSSDTVVINNSSANFDNANVGSGKTVTVAGLSLSGADAVNYVLASSSVTTTANITNAEPTASLSGKTATYTGSGIPSNVASVTNGTVSKTEYSTDGVNWTSTVPKQVGNYDVRVTVDGDANFADKAFTFNDALVITKKTLTVTASANDKVYDGNTTAVVTLSSDKVSGDRVTLSHTAANFDSAAVGANKTVTVTGISIGGADAGNYTLASATVTTKAAITQSIPLVVTVSASAITYGEALSNSTITGVVKNGLLNVKGTWVFETPSVNPLVSDSNKTTYGVVFTPEDTVSYSTVKTTVVVIVHKAVLTAKAEDKTKRYRATVPKLTVTYSGWVLGDDEGDLDTPPAAATAADHSSPVGSYPVTVAGGLDGNYSFNYIPGVLKVNKATPVYTNGTPVTAVLTYGESLEEAVFTGTYEDPATGVLIKGTYSYDNKSYNPTVPETGTAYAFTFTPTDTVNYNIVQTPVTATVKKAPLSVTADDQKRHFTASNPTLTVTYSGFVLGDKSSDLQVEPVLSTTADDKSPKGFYPITFASSVQSDNYAVTEVDGQLEVTNAVPVITTTSWSASVSELAVPGRLVGKAIESQDADFADADADEKVVYSLTDVNSIFTIHPDSGQIAVSDISNLDFDRLGSSVQVTVIVTDLAGDSSRRNFSITINDEDDFTDKDEKVSVTVVNGWNLISCPFEGWSPLKTMSKKNLDFVMYTYLDGVYRTHPHDEALVPGYGYWIFIDGLKSGELLNFLMLGTPPKNGTIPIKDGWNLIGPLAGHTVINEMDWVHGQPFAWDADQMVYTKPVDKLLLGHGYWGFAKNSERYVSVDWVEPKMAVNVKDKRLGCEIQGTMDYVICYVYDDDNNRVALKPTVLDMRQSRNERRSLRIYDLLNLAADTTYYIEIVPVRATAQGRVIRGRFHSNNKNYEIKVPMLDDRRLHRSKMTGGERLYSSRRFRRVSR